MKQPAGRRPAPFVAILAVLVALGVGWWSSRDEAPAPTPSPAASPVAAPAGLPADPAAWPRGTRQIPYQAGSERFVEISHTLDLIEAGGPFPYDRDGATFENRERRLPSGTYREYTVKTPGAYDRGARRLVVNQAGGLAWYSDDHYQTFAVVARVKLP